MYYVIVFFYYFFKIFCQSIGTNNEHILKNAIEPTSNQTGVSIFKESALRPILSSSRNVSLYICLSIYLSPPHGIFFRPLIGPQVT